MDGRGPPPRRTLLSAGNYGQFYYNSSLDDLFGAMSPFQSPSTLPSRHVPRFYSSIPSDPFSPSIFPSHAVHGPLYRETASSFSDEEEDKENVNRCFCNSGRHGSIHRLNSAATSVSSSLSSDVSNCSSERLVPGGTYNMEGVTSTPSIPSSSSSSHIPVQEKSAPLQSEIRESTSASHKKRLQERLAMYGFQERTVTGDGNCLFRAVSDQVCTSITAHVSLKYLAVIYIIWRDG